MLVPIDKTVPDGAEARTGDIELAPPRAHASLILPALVAVLLFGAFGLWWWKGRASAVQYVTAPVSEGLVAARVSANGTIAARVTVQIGSQVSGRIAEMLVDFNSKVTRGQVLARLDSELFRASVDQARANLTAARGILAKAEAQAQNAAKSLRRARALAARDLIAGADVDRAESDGASSAGDAAAAGGAVAQARAALRQSEANLAYTTIVSPIDGVVISRNVDVGQTVAASLQAPTLFAIAEDLGRMQIHTSVPEADVGKIRAGMKATFTVDAYPDDRWEGTVWEVRNASQVVQNVVTYDALVDVDNSSGRLRPGMTANVSFVYAERRHATLIPIAALRYQHKGDRTNAEKIAAEKADERLRGGWRPIYVLRPTGATRILVRPGISDGKLTEVVEGPVHAGDTVVIDEQADDGRTDGGRRRLPSRL